MHYAHTAEFAGLQKMLLHAMGRTTTGAVDKVCR